MKKIARITWNKFGWEKPSGKEGKSISGCFEAENKYGHEEWLFDKTTVINGYKYGFLQPIHKHRKKYEGEKFDIKLYSRNVETKAVKWVKTLNDVEVIYPEEAKEVLAIYKKNGWYDKMKKDLTSLELNPKHLDIWIKDGPEQLFNVKFKAIELETPLEQKQVTNIKEIPSFRYTLLNVR